MHKTFRLAVATLGVALAVMLLPPVAANASTNAPAGVSTVSAAQHVTTLAVTPNITRANCTSNTSHWVHVYTLSGTWWCVGYKGTYSGPRAWEYAICFGNNLGYIYGYDEYHNYLRFNFTIGYTGNVIFFSGLAGSQFYITSITITGWTGSGTCPAP
jgi:hypothetical protein